MWTNESCRMSHGEAAARFIQALMDPRITQEQKDRLIAGWNKYAEERRKQHG